jgi:glycerate dehydrogenase
MNIVITFFVEKNERSHFKSLENKANIIFLKDLDKNVRGEELSKADIIFTWNPLKELGNFEKSLFKQLKFVQLLSAGYDHINFDMFPDDCVIAANQGAYAEPMAEHTVAMILALSKRIIVNQNKMLKGEFDQATQNRSLKNSTAGIIGFGGIGKSTAKLLKNFDVNILAINTSGKTDEGVDYIGTLKDLDYVLAKSDIIILSIPLNKSTAGLISKRELELMKSNAMLINIARGDLIVEKDLFEHLQSHSEFLAGIDAWWTEPFNRGEFRLDYPFLNLPNVIGSPHNSALIVGALMEGQKRALHNLVHFIENKPMSGIINRD